MVPDRIRLIATSVDRIARIGGTAVEPLSNHLASTGPQVAEEG